MPTWFSSDPFAGIAGCKVTPHMSDKEWERKVIGRRAKRKQQRQAKRRNRSH